MVKIWLGLCCSETQPRSSTVPKHYMRYLYFNWVFPFYITVLLLHYISEGIIVLFTPQHLFDNFSY